jgi:uncharacterized membrane protein YkvA (DUF1232 family)
VKALLLLLPRLARMLGQLLLDRRVPRAAKLALAAAALYLASPIDLLPDALPWVGWLDDLVLVAVVLDGLLRQVDRDLVRRHWPAGAASLEACAEVAGRIARWVPPALKRRIFGG